MFIYCCNSRSRSNSRVEDREVFLCSMIKVTDSTFFSILLREFRYNYQFTVHFFKIDNFRPEYLNIKSSSITFLVQMYILIFSLSKDLLHVHTFLPIGYQHLVVVAFKLLHFKQNHNRKELVLCGMSYLF